VVGAWVGEQVAEGLGCGFGDGGVDGELVFVAVVDGVDVEDRQEPFDECAGGVGDDVTQVGQLVKQGRVAGRFV
jgi:hypothetical protein